ncbi:S24 family peptidase [Simonsiella muelleri]|uniref:S24 family peptidase n=1 Tax=Simonsiella muelleri TaxID=72 RepID=UPI0028D39763|nr:S24 family peptidase [Simonsiella muelleri]
MFFSNDVFVKRVQRVANKLIIKSANPDYEPFEIDLSEETDESIAIIGKVVWLGRRI